MLPRARFVSLLPKAIYRQQIILCHLTWSARSVSNLSIIISRHYCLFVTCFTSSRCSRESYWCAVSPHSRSSLPREEDEIHALPEVDSQVCCTYMHKYMHLEYGWTIFDSFLTSSRRRCRGQLLLPHLCSAVRAQSSLWTAYYPDTAPGESNQLQRCNALTPDGVGDESSHYISAG